MQTIIMSMFLFSSTMKYLLSSKVNNVWKNSTKLLNSGLFVFLLATIINPLYSHLRNKREVLRAVEKSSECVKLGKCVMQLEVLNDDRYLDKFYHHHIFDYFAMKNSWLNDIECVTRVIGQAEACCRQINSGYGNVCTIIVVGGCHAYTILDLLEQNFQYQVKREVSIEDDGCDWDKILS